jgi:putative hemolysin
MDHLLWGFFVVVVCLCLSAFFSATETALTSLSTLKTKHLRENSGKRGKVLDLWLHSPQKVLAASLIGNNLVNIGAAVYMDNLVEKAFGKHSPLGVTLVMTLLIVLFSEILPKTLAKTYATEVAIPVTNFFRPFYFLLMPFTWVLSFANQFFTNIITSGRQANPNPQITEEELEFLINVGEEEGVLAEQKHEMLSGIFELGDTVVREIMVHRIDMTAVAHTAKIVDIVEIFQKSGLSRIPVYEERIDNIIGILHSKDVLFFLKKHRDEASYWETTAADLKKETVFVPESKPVDQLFQELRKQRQHLAIVLDEYGGTSGLVTMEDIFEEVFGEVRDEFDNEEDAIRPTQIPNQYLVECKVHIDDFCDFFDLDVVNIIKGEGAYEFDTLGGFILHHFGQIPKIGDKLTIHRVTLEVIEVSRRRVRRVLAKILEPQTAVPSATTNTLPETMESATT